MSVTKGHSGGLRKGYLFVLSWARVKRRSISLELLMCSGGVRSILLLPLMGRCVQYFVIAACG